MMLSGKCCGMALLCLALAGCSATPSISYYALELPGAATPVRQTAQGPVVRIDRLQLPEYLNDQGIAFQQDDVQVVNATQARWAEALDRQLGRSLIRQLSTAWPDVQVMDTSAVASADSWSLSMEVSAFQGRADGKAVVEGRWVLQRGAQTYSNVFAEQVALQDDGYPALVRALRQGWQQAVTSVAGQVRPLLVTTR